MALPEIKREWIDANSLRFHVATCGSGEHLALFLHGFPECHYSWRHQMPMLAERGYRCWAPDLRGYGQTTRPGNVRDYAIETLMEDVAQLIDVSGARSTLLVAHDWGAIIAWYFAMRRTRPLAGLVIMNVPHPAIMERVIRTPQQMSRSWYALLFQIPWLPEALLRANNGRVITDMFRRTVVNRERFPEDVVRLYRNNALQPGALTGMLGCYRALVRGGGARRQRALGYPRIEVPTLMIWGEKDVALCKAASLGTDAYVEDLSLHHLPDVSHWVQQDAPDVVNRLIDTWLQEKSLAGPTVKQPIQAFAQ